MTKSPDKDLFINCTNSKLNSLEWCKKTETYEHIHKYLQKIKGIEQRNGKREDDAGCSAANTSSPRDRGTCKDREDHFNALKAENL